MGKQKDIALNKVVHNQDIELIDKLVYQYINGSPSERAEAQKAILDYFDSYLEKYVNLFAGMQVDLLNYDTRSFLAMFLTGRPKTPANLAIQRSYIANVMNRFSRDDIKNELVVLFLGVLSKYRIYPGVNALNPLTKFFRYRTKDWFNRVVKDALFKTVDVVQHTGSEDGYSDVEDWLNRHLHIESFEDESEQYSQLDISWVNSPSERIYRLLTRYERYLLFLAFNQELSLSEMAEKLERDKDTIKRHLKTILEKIEGMYQNEP